MEPRPANTKPKKQPQYAFVVLNDDEHTFGYVIEVLCRIFGYDLKKSFSLTKQADEEGRAIV